jgi:hypothetical protein
MPSVQDWLTATGAQAYRVTADTDVNSAAHAAWVDILPLTVSIPSGRYRLRARVNAAITSFGAGGVAMRAQLADITSGNVPVPYTETGLCSSGDTGAYAVVGEGTGEIDVIVSVSAQTTYRLQIQKVTTGGTPNTTMNMTVKAGSFFEYQSEV